MLTLRPYQVDLVERARSAIRGGCRSVLIQAPTGAGKTVFVAYMMRSAVERGNMAWFINHRRELVMQSVRTLIEAAGVPTAIIAAGFKADPRQPVQVCSVQSLRARADKYPPPTLIVWDEAHHVASRSWADVMRRFPNAVHIGITATPERLDGTGLGRWFQALIVGPSVRTLIDDGYLSDYKLFAPASNADLSGVHTVAGEYNRRELSAAMGKSAVTGDAVSEYRNRAMGKRALAFLWSVEASQALAARFAAAGIPAEHVDGDTDDRTRDAAMRRFRDGATLVLCNCDLFGEGVDVPALECVMLLRPTMSRGLFMQQIGRALRPAGGKTHALILDHANNVRTHGLPDDERQWTLEGRAKSRKPTEAPIRQCPSCYAIVPGASTACRHCGAVFAITPREVTQVDGALAEVDMAAVRMAARAEVRSARDRDQLMAIARERGYKPAWVDYVLRARQANGSRRAIKDGATIREWKGEA